MPVLRALQYAMEKGAHAIWLDHHVWPEGPRKAIQEMCELVLHSEKDGIKKCASELCAEKFLPDNKLAAQLAAIAHRTDFPDSAKFPIPPLTALISYYLGFPKLRDRLESVILGNVVKGVLWDTQMQADVMDASKLIDDSIAKSVSEMSTKEFVSDHFPGGIRVAIAKSESFVNRSILLGRIMDESPIHVAIGFTADGKVSIRKKDDAPSDIDCSKIALEFREGGGHVGAAGGFLHAAPEKDGDAAAIAEIVNALESYLSKLN
jgi:oligoribonuclease NrnB/cAMP/cGMP phosphodiesterase (DHH superfamily)